MSDDIARFMDDYGNNLYLRSVGGSLQIYTDGHVMLTHDQQATMIQIIQDFRADPNSFGDEDWSLYYYNNDGDKEEI